MSAEQDTSREGIARFLESLWLEDGLAQNTRSAYGRDLAAWRAVV
jgi:site-specific recombinase XerD